MRVRARRNVDSKNHIVYGAYKQLGSPGNPAFTFTGYPTGNPCTAPCNANVNIGAGDYVLPLATGNTRLPVFTWKPISGVQSYVVIVATDNTFQDVIDEAFTQIPAYAPRGTIPVTNYPDTSTNYAWAVLPAQGFDGSGGVSDPTTASSYPQTFDLHSVAPTPIEPLAGAVETTQPTFEWSPVVGAYQYKLYVTNNGVPVAGSPFITSGTSFTASNFPASNQLSWKVQALDRSGNGLTFFAAQQFSYSLAAPTFTVTNPTSGDGIPVWQWGPMPGAIAYDVHVQLPSNGQGQTDFSGIDSTAFTPTTMTGTGVFTWLVRAEYPTAGSNATSAYSAPQTFVRTIQAPQHPTTAVAGARQVSVTWDPKNTAKSYTVQFATDSGFGSSVFDQISDTENTAFAPVLTASQYIEGGPIYWRVAAKDADGNQGAWTTPQLLTMPALIHLTVTGSVSKGTTTTLKVTARTGAGKAIAGVSIKDGGCGLKAKTLKTGAGGAVNFKVKPTKSGTITFTATKTGAVGSKVLVSVF